MLASFKLLVAMAMALLLVAVTVSTGADAKTIGCDGKAVGKNNWKFNMNPALSVKAGVDKVKFTWSGATPHNVVRVNTKAEFDACDGSKGTTVGALGLKGGITLGPFVKGQTQYFLCSVSGHCQKKQAVAITGV